MSNQQHLLATKFFVPTSSQPLIPRLRLMRQLDEGWQRKLVLISAPPGFGKTTLLASWTQSLPKDGPRIAWVALDEEDNEPRRFWTYLFTALERSRPGICGPLLTFLQEQPALSLEYLLTSFINALIESQEQVILFLDDYHVIHEPAIHTSLSYLIAHQPPQLHCMIITRMDPPLPLSRLRARGELLEIRFDQLRCTLKEAEDFLKEVMNLSLSTEEIEDLEVRSEGWIAGLQLAALSLHHQTGSADLLKKKTWSSSRYILDYLTEEVLLHQPAEVQTFLLHTSLLDRLSAPLCDTVMGQTGSRARLEYLEQANLFVSALDKEGYWYRYHALFAEALRHYLIKTDEQAIPELHVRASRWYADQKQTNEAVKHALLAKAWEWAADLIEAVPYLFDWGERQAELVALRQWLEQLPADIVRARPRLCLTYAKTHYTGEPLATTDAWLRIAETKLTASLSTQGASLPQEHQKNLLGEVMAFRAYLDSYYGDGRATRDLSEKALTYLAQDQYAARAEVAFAQFGAAYSLGEMALAVRSVLEASVLAQEAGNTSTAILCKSLAILSLMWEGKLHEAWQMSQEAVRLGEAPDGLLVTTLCWVYAFQADILREWNRLDEALQRIRQAIHLSEQSGAVTFIYAGYSILARIYRVCGDLDAASEVLQHIEYIPANWEKPNFRAIYFTVERVRLWLERGELVQAAHWLQEPSRYEGNVRFLPCEQEEIARIRILLAQNRASEALKRLAPLFPGVQATQRTGRLIELLLLQAIAFQMNGQKREALDTLNKAVQLAEPEGYIRMFADEKKYLASLLLSLRAREQEESTIRYLDSLLSAAQMEKHVQECDTHRPPPQQPLLEPLTNRELEVLHLLARGASNQEISETLVVTVNTVKRHLGNIFMKLDVSNRTQAVIHAHSLGLISETSPNA